MLYSLRTNKKVFDCEDGDAAPIRAKESLNGLVARPFAQLGQFEDLNLSDIAEIEWIE